VYIIVRKFPLQKLEAIKLIETSSPMSYGISNFREPKLQKLEAIKLIET